MFKFKLMKYIYMIWCFFISSIFWMFHLLLEKTSAVCFLKVWDLHYIPQGSASRAPAASFPRSLPSALYSSASFLSCRRLLSVLSPSAASGASSLALVTLVAPLRFSQELFVCVEWVISTRRNWVIPEKVKDEPPSPRLSQEWPLLPYCLMFSEVGPAPTPVSIHVSSTA